MNKDLLIKYFEKTKWYDESLNNSFVNDFNIATLSKDFNFNDVNFQLINSLLITEIKYFYIHLNIFQIENNLVFIPLYKQENNYIGIGYLFTSKSLENLNNLEIKTFCKFIINDQELNQMLLL